MAFGNDMGGYNARRLHHTSLKHQAVFSNAYSLPNGNAYTDGVLLNAKTAPDTGPVLRPMSLADQLAAAKDSQERFVIMAAAVKVNPEAAAKQFADMKPELVNLDKLDLKGVPNPDLMGVLKALPGDKISLKGANLASQTLNDPDLNLKGADLEGATLGNISGLDLTETKMKNVTFPPGTKLTNVKMANLEGVKAAGVIMDNVIITNAKDVDLSGATFINTTIKGNLQNVKFDNANITGLTLLPSEGSKGVSLKNTTKLTASADEAAQMVKQDISVKTGWTLKQSVVAGGQDQVKNNAPAALQANTMKRTLKPEFSFPTPSPFNMDQSG